MSMLPIDGFFYYQDDEHATVLVINHLSNHAMKIMNCPVDECMRDDSLQFISEEIACILLEGLNRKFYIVQEINYNEEEPSEEQVRKFKFFEKINNKLMNPDYKKYIDQEKIVYDIFTEKRMAFTDIINKHDESILKINKEFVHECMNGYAVDENVPESKRIDIIVERLANERKNGYSVVKEKLLKNKEYVESNEIAKQIFPAYMDFFKALIDLEQFIAREYQLFSDDYKKKMDEYAEKGLFLFFQNTPDLPIDEEDVSIEDVYNYYLNDDAMYLVGIMEQYINKNDAGKIYDREGNDLIASYNQLLYGNYWAALRNLYALIDHHHKLCSDIFNGYEEAKVSFKNGKERSEYISKLFNDTKVFYYEEVWKKINEAIEEINKGTGTRFIPRNSIIHGDYENMKIEPKASDVINVLFIYITMRGMIDHLANIEEAYKYTDSYLKVYEKNFKNMEQ